MVQHIQRELIAIADRRRLTPDPTNDAQLLAALKILFTAKPPRNPRSLSALTGEDFPCKKISAYTPRPTIYNEFYRRRVAAVADHPCRGAVQYGAAGADRHAAASISRHIQR
ncbi:hypothetical protein [Pantoea stewartii]|uniref:hypothetical protein n=1 Tax=Pantoea stewartii TaxID=66269 RepID=UPI0025A257F7|nr:hypothetical protein [Pantoea stewartii]